MPPATLKTFCDEHRLIAGTSTNLSWLRDGHLSLCHSDDEDDRAVPAPIQAHDQDVQEQVIQDDSVAQSITVTKAELDAMIQA